MRAVVHDRYGPPEVLRLEDVEPPVPQDDEVLVRVRATSVTRSDCGWRAAKPFLTRFFTGIRRPKNRILGSEFAGTVEAVGPAVTEFAVGDEVFGTTGGFRAHAELLCIRESAPIAHKPSGTAFEEAGAVCDGAILALNPLRPADLRPGRRLLVYGASGSMAAKTATRATAGRRNPSNSVIFNDRLEPIPSNLMKRCACARSKNCYLIVGRQTEIS